MRFIVAFGLRPKRERLPSSPFWCGVGWRGTREMHVCDIRPGPRHVCATCQRVSSEATASRALGWLSTASGKIVFARCLARAVVPDLTCASIFARKPVATLVTGSLASAAGVCWPSRHGRACGHGGDSLPGPHDGLQCGYLRQARAQIGRSLKHGSGWRRRMRNLDAKAALAKHATEPLMKRFLEELYLRSAQRHRRAWRPLLRRRRLGHGGLGTLTRATHRGCD